MAKAVRKKDVKKEPVLYTKADIVDQIAEESDYMKSAVAEMTNLIFAKISQHIANGDHVQVHKFGTWSVRDTAARIGRNPKTNEALEIPAGKRVCFKFSSTVKKSVKSEE